MAIVIDENGVSVDGVLKIGIDTLAQLGNKVEQSDIDLKVDGLNIKNVNGTIQDIAGNYIPPYIYAATFSLNSVSVSATASVKLPLDITQTNTSNGKIILESGDIKIVDDGVYKLTINADITNFDGGYLYISLRNGGTQLLYAIKSDSAGRYHTYGNSAIYTLLAGDLLDFYIVAESDSDYAIQGGPAYTNITVERIK